MKAIFLSAKNVEVWMRIRPSQITLFDNGISSWPPGHPFTYLFNKDVGLEGK